MPDCQQRVRQITDHWLWTMGFRTWLIMRRFTAGLMKSLVKSLSSMPFGICDADMTTFIVMSQLQLS